MERSKNLTNLFLIICRYSNLEKYQRIVLWQKETDKLLQQEYIYKYVLSEKYMLYSFEYCMKRDTLAQIKRK